MKIMLYYLTVITTLKKLSSPVYSSKLQADFIKLCLCHCAPTILKTLKLSHELKDDRTLSYIT